MDKDRKGWILIGILALVLIAIIALVIFYPIIGQLPDTPEVLLSPILIIGVIALLVALAFTTTVFKSLDLTDRNQTLGLPEGSIRAVIALSLILIFMMCSVFLYYQVANPTIKDSRGITKDMLNLFPNETIAYIQVRNQTIDNETVYNVGRIVEKNSTSEDIAKQIITTVSTLVVAVAGFYFGSKAVSTAAGAVAVSDPVIRTVTTSDGRPATGKPGSTTDLVITGKNFELGKEGKVRFVHPSGSVPCTDIMSSSEKITCKFTLPAGIKEGEKYTLVLTNDDQAEDRLDNAFTVTAPSTAPEQKPPEQKPAPGTK